MFGAGLLVELLLLVVLEAVFGISASFASLHRRRACTGPGESWWTCHEAESPLGSGQCFKSRTSRRSQFMLVSLPKIET